MSTCELRYVDGLQRVFVREPLQASFVFETKAQAIAATKKIDESLRATSFIGSHQEKCPDMSRRLTELLPGKNISDEEDVSRVLSCVAKTQNTVGRPLKSIDEMLLQLGNLMGSSSTKEHPVSVIKLDCQNHYARIIVTNEGDYVVKQW